MADSEKVSSLPSTVEEAMRAEDDEPICADESLCPECEGDGGDKWNDYCLPCPTCGGDGRLW